MADKPRLYLESIVQHIPDMIFVKDAKHLRFVLFNEAGERLLGMTKQDMYGKSDRDFFPPEEAAFFEQKDREVLERGDIVDIPFEPIQTVNGPKWLHTRKVPILDSDGTPLFLLGISTDVTARHEAQQQLKAVLDRFPGAVWEVRGGQVRRLAGDALMEEEEVLAHAAQGADFEHAASDRFYTGSVEQLEGELLLVVAVDVTGRRRLETEERQRQLSELQRMESLGQLAGGIAHDFNNLLVGILGNATLGLDAVGPDHPARTSIERIEKAARRASDLSRQMLAYSGRGHFVVKKVDVGETLREMSPLLRAGIGKKCQLSFVAQPNLPPVTVDTRQFQQLLMNLITNAADAIEDAGTIEVTAELMDIQQGFRCTSWLEHELSPGRYVAVTVIDSGCGMNDATRQRMFDPFFTTKADGHGLGLAAALGILRGHGGSVQVQSEVGHGTTIRVLLPASAEELVGAATSPSRAPSTTGHVLVVDDEEAVREFVTAALEHHGFRVSTAVSGDDAVSMDGPFDVVVLDLSMPGMSALETIRRLKAQSPNLPILLSSGYDRSEATRDLEPGEVVGFLPKPYSLSDLVNHIKAAL